MEEPLPLIESAPLGHANFFSLKVHALRYSGEGDSFYLQKFLPFPPGIC